MKMLCYFLLYSVCLGALADGLNALDAKNVLAADVKAYCQYVRAKEEAKRDTLLSPELLVRAQNTTDDYPYQNNLITAFSKDMADLAKSKQLKALVKEECRYYALEQEVNLQAQFALPYLQRQTLVYKLQQVNQALLKMKGLLAQVEDQVKRHNETLAHFYTLEAAYQALEDKKRDIGLELAIQRPVPIKALSLQKLSQALQQADKARQARLNKIERLKNWSLQLQAGAQQNLTTFRHSNTVANSKATQPYAAVTLRYNLGSPLSHYNQNKSLGHYSNWKSQQIVGSTQQLKRLYDSIGFFISSEEQRLHELRKSYRRYATTSNTLEAVDSATANRLKQQLAIHKILLEIEMNSTGFFIKQLKDIH